MYLKLKSALKSRFNENQIKENIFISDLDDNHLHTLYKYVRFKIEVIPMKINGRTTYPLSMFTLKDFAIFYNSCPKTVQNLAR